MKLNEKESEIKTKQNNVTTITVSTENRRKKN